MAPPSTQTPPRDLCVAVCTFNSMRTLPRLIDSVDGWSARVLLVDSGSTDGTVDYGRGRGCEVVHRAWEGMLSQRAFCLEQAAAHAWILLLDSDESVEPDLRQAIERMLNDDATGAPGAVPFDAFDLNRKVFFEGGWLHHTFQPEYRVRLVRGGRGRVAGSGPTGRGIHDRIEVQGGVGRLTGTLRHDSWFDLEDFWTRSIRYSRDAARTGERGGGVFDILMRPSLAFLKQYVLRRGFLDGRRGFMMASMLATGNAMKQITIAMHRWRGTGHDRIT
ncbi:MAG: glycosyltransferase family 2 protein [Phycisphaeraceae bacterium]|nr:glycosyltransferase family 2 protein [Phycisphaeraceae bacterium]